MLLNTLICFSSIYTSFPPLWSTDASYWVGVFLSGGFGCSGFVVCFFGIFFYCLVWGFLFDFFCLFRVSLVVGLGFYLFFNVQPKYKIKSAYNANCYFLADESLKLRDVTTSHFSSMEVSEISDITFKRSVHFTSPPSTVPLCHLIKQNTYRLKTKKNMWEGLDFLPHHISAQHPGWSDQHRKVTNRSHAVWKQSRQCRCAHQKQEG